MLMMPALSYLGTTEQAPPATPPDSDTTFLCRFINVTPTDEISLATGTLVGNASCDTANSELVLDGTGDYCTFPANSVFSPFIDGTGTIEFHANMAAAQVGGILSRSPSGSTRYAFYCSGSGDLAFYADGFSPVSPLLNFSFLDGNWHHVAVVRNSAGTPRWAMYVDGVQQSTNTWTSAPIDVGAGALHIGVDVADLPNRDVAGRIARVKYSGTARYTAGFTPPSRTAV